MADRQDEKHPYKSRFAVGLWITPVQYLAENMVARLATRDRYQLPDRFWLKSDRWACEFKVQAVHAGKLLAEFGIEAVIAALRTTRGKQLYSLGARARLLPLVRDEQRRVDARKAAAEAQKAAEPSPEPTAPAQSPAAPRPAFVEKTALSKLKGL
jgi:hypothetical protein